MPRVLLTGANGFVGKILTQRLRDAGYHVTALSSSEPQLGHPADQQRVCDIRDAEGVRQAVAQVRPSHVIHLAAVSHVPTSFQDPLGTWQTNVMGSMNLLEALRLEAPEAFVLFSSSSEVYGAAFKSGQEVDEYTRCQPLNPYAASKVAAESAFNEYFRQGLKGVIARPFNHIGAQQSPNFVTASFARQIALIEAGQQEPVLKVGNLEAKRDFLDVQDVCSAYLELLKLADSTQEYPRCMNIASGRSLKIREVLDTLLSLSQASIQVAQDPERLRPSDIPVAIGNSTALTRSTGWQPQIPLQQTLRELLDYWRQQTV
ncbi:MULTISPECIES: GDP-mannose 4,6-dehydratase [Pseudomonas]|jgi:GDP-4-dehydro-6-deoxy-D-mannose reductase|uniref:GDP-mannose 4,6-dehydratase n=1 Tax=Pseudomonas TaxID=286 RepID=UPI000CEB745E|nr:MULTISPECIES: GDP-mannose 4,6-dehydratase [Pseudomonas]EKX8761383.1 GDP-mannose 4,6-dehydratase [Pseudomonas aeruginosa]AVH34832.1 GDP-6-deoxy-D-lyxo-4-hexulose reductase [Pseudomonas monteilii]MDM9596632.1 GDP-mannose 4,6-dehydratase [Pseudomonas guariconensis]MDM9609478.1 GDP-mannose 4,6-dehydratase [Pseudomonas guariconensis]MEB3881587.1 GDP-mannose 4,6-dehydratase [Pseudomonas guariconensis]